MKKVLLVIISISVLIGCSEGSIKEKTIIAVPIYGQSLALGEEAELVTNFDTLRKQLNHRFFTENLDESFGFYANTIFKQKIKRILNYTKRKFEISSYGMAEYVVTFWKKQANEDFLFCSFPGGQGATGIDFLGEKSSAYQKMLSEIRNAYDLAKKKECKFIVPAICWMQGENDLVWNIKGSYKDKLSKLRSTFERDIKSITKQTIGVKFIMYQTNCLTISKLTFDANNHSCPQTRVPQAQLELLLSDSNFVASGPTYPYVIKREYVHLDGISQKRMGYLQGISLIKMLSGEKVYGLIPISFIKKDKSIIISFNVPVPPLVIDTVNVSKIENYGFSVINKKNKNVLNRVFIEKNNVHLQCNEHLNNVKVRYAVNGMHWKTGNMKGPRGNLRDSQGLVFKCKIGDKYFGLDNWCYMFDYEI